MEELTKVKTAAVKQVNEVLQAGLRFTGSGVVTWEINVGGVKTFRM